MRGTVGHVIKLKYGTISLIEKDMPVISIIIDNNIREKNFK